MEQAKAAFNGHVEDLRRVMSQAGYTRGEIDALIAKYHLTPDRINTIVGITDNASGPLASLSRRLSDIARQAVNTTVNINAGGGGGYIGGMAAGGIVDRKMLSWVGEEGPELCRYP